LYNTDDKDAEKHQLRARDIFTRKTRGLAIQEPSQKGWDV
jgi:hypothetical protein